LTVIICFLTVTACSSIHSAKVGTLNTGNAYNGQIISIEQTKLNAHFSKRLTGATIGHFIAVGLGANSGLQFVSAMTGVAITNKEHGQMVDLIEVHTADGQEYKTLVPLNYFSLNETVTFTANKNAIDSIVRIKGS
jgi:outer membrane lipoprotein SlyB